MRGFWQKKNVHEAAEAVVVTETAPKGGVVTTSATLRDLLVVTYAVPAERVRAHVPEGLRPDLLLSAEGESLAFLQTTCAYHEDSRWSPLPGSLASSSYHQVAHRILTRREGKRGAFVLRTFISSTELSFSRRAIERTMEFARFTIYVDGNPAHAAYRRYNLRAVGETAKTELEVTALSEGPAAALPFTHTEERDRFLIQREELFYRAGAYKKGISLTPIQYGPVTPTYGQIATARLSLWTDLNLLTPEELTTPVVVHILPELTTVTSPPRLVKL